VVEKEHLGVAGGNMWTGIERRKIERRKQVSNNYEDCPLGVKHESEICAMKLNIETLTKDIRDIKERLLSRPSWFVTVIITLLSTLAFSALTFAFTIVHELTRLGIK
jgi:hypothetical protein